MELILKSAWGMLQMLNFRTPRMAFSPGLPFGGLELGSGADAKGSNGVVTASPATRLCGYFCRGRPPEITLSAILGANLLGQWCVIHRFILDNLSIKYQVQTKQSKSNTSNVGQYMAKRYGLIPV